MITHSVIIDRFTGPSELARITGMTTGAAKQARRRGSIAPKYWSQIVAAGKATLEELAEASTERARAA